MKISIVDDDANWIERIKGEVLLCDEDNDMEIDVFSSGEEYLKGEEQYDISFIDIEMPGIDGFETISKARQYNSEGIYVILTTHAEMSRKGYVVSAFRFLDKMVLEEIKETIEGKRLISGCYPKVKSGSQVRNPERKRFTLFNTTLLLYIFIPRSQFC